MGNELTHETLEAAKVCLKESSVQLRDVKIESYTRKN